MIDEAEDEVPPVFWGVTLRSGDCEVLTDADGRELQQVLRSAQNARADEWYECTCLDGATLDVRLADISSLRRSTPETRERDQYLAKFIREERKEIRQSIGWVDDE